MIIQFEPMPEILAIPKTMITYSYDPARTLLRKLRVYMLMRIDRGFNDLVYYAKLDQVYQLRSPTKRSLFVIQCQYHCFQFRRRGCERAGWQ